MDALKAVYPATCADLQQKIGERLAVWQKPLTYQQRLAFSAILGPKALASDAPAGPDSPDGDASACWRARWSRVVQTE